MTELSKLEQALGFAFADKSLLLRALTHRSYLNEHPDFPLEDNERLEFLGDAVLDFLTGEYLYNRFPELAEGPLTSLRSALVRREALADFAGQLALGEYLLMGHGEAESGGRSRSANLCAGFEALVGALYLDQGLEAVRSFLEPLVEPEVARIIEENSDKDAKSLLQELVQGRIQRTPRYVTVGESGPDHAKEFTVEVTIARKAFARGTGHSKQQAAQDAARQALEQLDAEGLDILDEGEA